MKYLRSFALFWWNFVVGDDWRVAAGLAVALGLTSLLTHEGINAWWLLPLAVAGLLAVSLQRETQPRRPASGLRSDP
jgi:apolipoprotein N-acyltransferase